MLAMCRRVLKPAQGRGGIGDSAGLQLTSSMLSPSSKADGHGEVAYLASLPTGGGFPVSCNGQPFWWAAGQGHGCTTAEDCAALRRKILPRSQVSPSKRVACRCQPPRKIWPP